MGKTVFEMMRQMPAIELDEWRAFDRINPIGDYRMDLNFARLYALQVEVKQGDTLEDFLAIDPSPMLPEMKAKIEAAKAEAKRKAELDASVAKWQAMLS